MRVHGGWFGGLSWLGPKDVVHLCVEMELSLSVSVLGGVFGNYVLMFGYCFCSFVCLLFLNTTTTGVLSEGNEHPILGFIFTSGVR